MIKAKDIPSEHPKPHSCKCNRHPDSAFTVIKLDEGLSKCPRCGGIIIPRLPKQTTQPSHTDVTLEEIEKIIALKMAQMIIEDLPDKLGYTKARILAQAILERITKDK